MSDVVKRKRYSHSAEERGRMDLDWWRQTHPDEYASPEDAMVDEIYVEKMLLELPEHYRRVIFLTYFQCKTVKEIAPMSKKLKADGTRIGEPMVRKRRTKALKILRAMVTRDRLVGLEGMK